MIFKFGKQKIVAGGRILRKQRVWKDSTFSDSKKSQADCVPYERVHYHAKVGGISVLFFRATTFIVVVQFS